MNAPFLIPALTFLVGIGVRFLGLSLSTRLIWMILLILVLALWKVKYQKVFLCLIGIAFFCLGLLATNLSEKTSLHSVRYFVQDSRISLEGIVVSDPVVKTKGKKKTVSFVLDSENLIQWIEQRREFHEVKGKIQVFLFQSETTPKFGDRVRMRGKLENPRKVLNPGGFDYGAFLRSQGIEILFKGFGKKSLRIINRDQKAFFFQWVHKMRMEIEQKIEIIFDSQTRAFAKALVLGRRHEIAPYWRDQFMKTGTSHLLAISGLHVALVSGSFYLLMLFFRLPSKIAIGLTLIAIGLQVFIAGAGIPVRRAGWMTAIGLLAIAFNRERHAINTFFFTLFLFLFMNPRDLTSLSFQLSFLSVFSMVIFLKDLGEKWRWSEAFARTLMIMVGTFPLIAYYFNIFSWISLFANALAIPFFHVALLGIFSSLLVANIPWFSSFVTVIADISLQAGLAWIRFLSQVDWGYFFLSSPSKLQIVSYYGLLGLTFFLWKTTKKLLRPFRFLTLVAFVLIFAGFFRPDSRASFEFSLLSAGKNEIGHLQVAGNQNYVWNTGRKSSNQVRWILEPYLRQRGVNQLTGVILSDFYQKHVGGFDHLLNHFKPTYVFFPKIHRVESKKKLGKIPYRVNQVPLSQEDQIELSPDVKFQVFESEKEKLTFLLKAHKWRFLLFTTMNQKVLADLELNLAETHAEVLILPSSGSLSFKEYEALIRIVKPQIIISSKEDEALKLFPSSDEIHLWSLDQTGALTFWIDKNEELKVRSFLKGSLAL